MHFSLPKSSHEHDTKPDTHGIAEEREAEEREEEVSEWREGPDVVVERQPCKPGEDVQVEVLPGANRTPKSSPAKSDSRPGHESILRKEEEELKKVKERCKTMGREMERGVERVVGSPGHAGRASTNGGGHTHAGQ